jgi:hypothetical protein
VTLGIILRARAKSFQMSELASFSEPSRQSALQRFQLLRAHLEREFGVVLDKCFSQTPPTFIRTNDALHLASAKVAGEPEFITGDVRQRAAALLMGFRVLP